VRPELPESTFFETLNQFTKLFSYLRCEERREPAASRLHAVSPPAFLQNPRSVAVASSRHACPFSSFPAAPKSPPPVTSPATMRLIVGPGGDLPFRPPASFAERSPDRLPSTNTEAPRSAAGPPPGLSRRGHPAAARKVMADLVQPVGGLPERSPAPQTFGLDILIEYS